MPNPLRTNTSSLALSGRVVLTCLTAVLVFLSGAATASSPVLDDKAVPTKGPAVARIAVIGASVSAGFGTARELSTTEDVPLAVFLRAALASKDVGVVTGDGDPWLFRDSRRFGKSQVDRALDSKATLVIGVDFLFWYAFGHPTGSDPRRTKGLEAGLAELDRIACPIVIGDLPDVRHALQGKGPFGRPMIRRDMLPTEQERNLMNEKIRAWAQKRGDVAIVPLASMTRDMMESRPIVVRGNKWTVREPQDALQPDLLHLTSRGTVWLVLSIADSATRLEGVYEGAFLWDEIAIRQRVADATRASREARSRKEQERRERRKQADRKREEAGKTQSVR